MTDFEYSIYYAQSIKDWHEFETIQNGKTTGTDNASYN